jgi:hypothetical protein
MFGAALSVQVVAQLLYRLSSSRPIFTENVNFLQITVRNVLEDAGLHKSIT